LTTSYIGDAFAGERERHTLETLLASPVSDRAILWGKITVSIAYAWGLSLIGLLLGLVVSNLLSGQDHWEFYHPLDIFVEMLALSLSASLLSASAGVLVSLRAATVRQAQQTMAVGTLILLIAIDPQICPLRRTREADGVPASPVLYRRIHAAQSDTGRDRVSQIPAFALDLSPGNSARNGVSSRQS